MDISSVEQYIGYTVASQLMKESLGDGMEYELVFQALLEQMQNNNVSSEVSEEEIKDIFIDNKSMDDEKLRQLIDRYMEIKVLLII